MKIFVKIVLVVLILAMLMALTACFGDAIEDVEEQWDIDLAGFSANNMSNYHSLGQGSSAYLLGQADDTFVMPQGGIDTSRQEFSDSFADTLQVMADRNMDMDVFWSVRVDDTCAYYYDYAILDGVHHYLYILYYPIGGNIVVVQDSSNIAR